MTYTMTREEANRAREAAVDRRHNAQDHQNSWARVIAEHACRGNTILEETRDSFIIARAEAFEARADWQEARERWQASA